MRIRIWASVAGAVVVALLIACASNKQAVPPPGVAGLVSASNNIPQASNNTESPLVRDVGPFDTETYDHIDKNRFRRVDVDSLSTFSVDVDTASYANVRRFLRDGGLPPAGAVRIEELIN